MTPTERRARAVTNLRQQLAWIHDCRNSDGRPCKGCRVRAEMLYDQTVSRRDHEPAPA